MYEFECKKKGINPPITGENQKQKNKSKKEKKKWSEGKKGN